MAQRQGRGIDVVHFCHGGRHAVAVAHGLDVVTSSTAGASEASDLDLRLFGDRIDSEAGAKRALMVPTASGAALLRTGSTLRLERLELDSFIQLPRLLRAVGCRPWLCGFVEIPSALPEEPPALATWIDLQTLAEELSVETQPDSTKED